MKKIATTGLFLFTISALSGIALATTFVNRPLNDVVKESPNIVRGRAGDSYSDWDKGGEHRSIYTYYYFTVTEVLKGNIKETKILLRQPGGTKDGSEMNVPGTAHFAPDEDVVVMLGEKNKEDGSYDVPGFTTGKYNVVPAENGEPVLVNSLGGGAMYDPSQDSRTLSYNSKIPLEVFRRIAQGEDIPEAAHRQFERSAKPAAKGAFEEGHPQHFIAKHGDSGQVTALPPPQKPQQQQAVEQKPVERGATDSWVPISFGVLAVIGGLALWWIFKSGKGGQS